MRLPLRNSRLACSLRFYFHLPTFSNRLIIVSCRTNEQVWRVQDSIGMIPGQDPDLTAPTPRAVCIREVSIQLQPPPAGSRKSGSFLVRRTSVNFVPLSPRRNSRPNLRPKHDVGVLWCINAPLPLWYRKLTSLQGSSLKSQAPPSAAAYLWCRPYVHRLRPFRSRLVVFVQPNVSCAIYQQEPLGKKLLHRAKMVEVTPQDGEPELVFAAYLPRSAVVQSTFQVFTCD